MCCLFDFLTYIYGRVNSDRPNSFHFCGKVRQFVGVDLLTALATEKPAPCYTVAGDSGAT